MKFPVSHFKFPAAHSAFRVSRSARRGFTLVEIAICLGIIGIALVAIIGILPRGLHTQKDSRQETIVGQDASVIFEAVRNGSRGADDLTNYVYAVVNSWSNVVTHTRGIEVYTNRLALQFGSMLAGFSSGTWHLALTTGSNIIGLMSTPEYTAAFGGSAMPSLLFGGISNHITVFVTALSGVASERPPQDNDILRSDAFGYRIYVVNAPMPVDTNLFFLHPLWSGQTNVTVFYDWTYWQPTPFTTPTDVPGQSANWVKDPVYPLEQQANQRELRMTFLWPLLPNGNPGNGRQTFRTIIGGQLAPDFVVWPNYFYQSRTFSPAR